MGLPSRDRAGGPKERKGLTESDSTGAGWKEPLSHDPATEPMGFAARREVLQEFGLKECQGRRPAVRWGCGRGWEATERWADFRGVLRGRARGAAR